jgi:glutamyl-tRNA synthetase
MLTHLRESVLRGRTLFQYISLLLRADAKSYTNVEEFLSRNNTFFTTSLNRPPYVATSSKKSSHAETSSSVHVPVSTLHIAATALCLVPESHWTAETHRLNIASYNGAAAVDFLDSDKSVAEEDLAADRAFKRELYHFLRWALSAGAPGPGIPETMEILGRTESIRRLEEARGLTYKI